MSPFPAPDTRVRHSDDVVARLIEGELLIVPLVSGVGDLEDELYTLNETGRAIWEKLDGSRTIDEVAREMAREFDVAEETARLDVINLVDELLGRKILIAG
jgi:Coenzyme PQQ synthesis protein D (PqqD)